MEWKIKTTNLDCKFKDHNGCKNWDNQSMKCDYDTCPIKDKDEDKIIKAGVDFMMDTSFGGE